MCLMTDEPTTDQPLLVSAVARLLGVSDDTVRRIPPADLPFWRKTRHGARQYKREDVERYIREVQGRTT